MKSTRSVCTRTSSYACMYVCMWSSKVSIKCSRRLRNAFPATVFQVVSLKSSFFELKAALEKKSIMKHYLLKISQAVIPIPL